MSHIPPLDPNVAARKGFKESEERVKRFWKEAGVAQVEDGWAVVLDGRTPKTPAHRKLVLPTQASAQLVADEWAAQGEFLDAGTMPATRLASTAIDRVVEVMEAVADEITAYAGNDLTCYLAEVPQSLVERQEREWGAWRNWAETTHGIKLVPVNGIIHQPQDQASLDKVKALALSMDHFQLSCLAMAVPLLGSAILGLALQQGAISGAEAYDLSRLDEAFTEERWGVDEEASARTAAQREETVMLERWFKALV
jgi:chaperone required for assembly of F1-ATPase